MVVCSTHDFDRPLGRQLFLLLMSVLEKPVVGPMRKRIRGKNTLPVSSWKTFYDVEKEPIGSAHGGSLYELCRKVPDGYAGFSRPQMTQGAVPNPANPLCLTSNLSDIKTITETSPLSSQSITCHLPPECYVVEVMRKVLQALKYMHQQLSLVHLDIKAENILLRQPYPSTDVFITDFGLATVLTEGKQHRELAGTPDYVAPEIINYDPVSFATDMWSVGVLTYFLLTGVSPFLASEKEKTMQNITHGTIEFPSDLFEHRSSASVDFLRGLLVRKPGQRMTADQCLKHEWLQTTYAADETAPAWSSAESNVGSAERLEEEDTDSGSKLAHLCVKPHELLSSTQSVPLKPTLFSRSDYEPNSVISTGGVNRLFNQQGDYFVRLGLVTELIPLRSVDLCKIQMYIQALFPTHSLPIHHVYIDPLQMEQTHIMSCGAPTSTRVPAQYRLPRLLSIKPLERSLSNRRCKSELSITVIPCRCPVLSQIADQSTSLLIHLKSYKCTSRNLPKPSHSHVTPSYGDHHATSLAQNSALHHLPTADYPPFSLCSPQAPCVCVYEPSLDDPVTPVHFPPKCNVYSEPDTWHRQHHRLANLESRRSQRQSSGHALINKVQTRLPGLDLIVRLFYHLHFVCLVVWRFTYSAIFSNLSTRLRN
ncbi:serine/threonine kinase 17 [Paragonimus westermani]|uniref:Serine/threonine kinase 17 n=1 Tax=Paragonimus westermani TaxID=34504 RepID=A0A5J4NIS6_9TREM|nr:serine/threonine kinase 17 [Paragonimus westermani]